MSKSNALSVKEKVGNIRELLERNQETIMSVLPKAVDPDRMVKVMFNSVRSSPALLDADPTSLMSAIINSATLGLEPNTPLGLAYLLPFKNNKKGITEIVFLVGYKGMVALAKRSGSINSVSVILVWENEPFEYYESDQGTKIVHSPMPPSERGDKLKAGYCRVVLPDGHRPDPVVLWADEIEAVRQRSRAKDSGPWVTDYPEMARKTILRRAFKLLDLDTSVNRAVALDEQYEAGLTPRDFVLAGEDALLAMPEIGTVERKSEENGEKDEKPASQEPSKEKKTPPRGKSTGKPKEQEPPKDEGQEEPSKDEGPSRGEEIKVNIRELCESLGRDDSEIIIMKCNNDDELEAERRKLRKTYQERLNDGTK